MAATTFVRASFVMLTLCASLIGTAQPCNAADPTPATTSAKPPATTATAADEFIPSARGTPDGRISGGTRGFKPLKTERLPETSGLLPHGHITTMPPR